MARPGAAAPGTGGRRAESGTGTGLSAGGSTGETTEKPALLMLDEPASGLSHGEVDELAGLIEEVRAGTTVLLVEHHMGMVMRLSDTVVVLDFGKVVATGPPAAVREDPAVLAAYLGTPA